MVFLLSKESTSTAYLDQFLWKKHQTSLFGITEFKSPFLKFKHQWSRHSAFSPFLALQLYMDHFTNRTQLNWSSICILSYKLVRAILVCCKKCILGAQWAVWTPPVWPCCWSGRSCSTSPVAPCSETRCGLDQCVTVSDLLADEDGNNHVWDICSVTKLQAWRPKAWMNVWLVDLTVEVEVD